MNAQQIQAESSMLVSVKQLLVVHLDHIAEVNTAPVTHSCDTRTSHPLVVVETCVP